MLAFVTLPIFYRKGVFRHILLVQNVESLKDKILKDQYSCQGRYKWSIQTDP